MQSAVRNPVCGPKQEKYIMTKKITQFSGVNALMMGVFDGLFPISEIKKHALSYLSSKGRAAIVCFPGIFYRGGAEQKIRQYLVDNNYVDTVIALAPNLFFGTSIAVNILILAKNKRHSETAFIDAGNIFKKETNNNILTEENIAEILKLFADKQDVDYKMKMVSYEAIKENNYNLSVSSYVEQEDKSEKIDIQKLNAELKETVEKIDKLRAEIDQIVAEIEA